MDKLIVQGLELYAHIGVTAAEREVGQRLRVNLEATYDLAAAGRSDDLEDTISYAAIAQSVYDVGTALQCQLLERMAEAMVQAVLQRFPVEEVRLQLFKNPPPTALPMAQAGVEIVRRRVR